MKKKHILNTLLFINIFSSISLQSTSNWKSSKSAGGSDDENQYINFYGVLTTHQGQKNSVGHILIGGKHNDIIMYDAPVKHADELFNQKTKQTEIKLEENPITAFSFDKIDLNTISSIKVPTPNVIWVYQKEKKYQKLEFVLVEITYKTESTQKKYLLERKTHISCNSIDNGAQKKEVPLTAIDTLTIEGYSFTLNEEQSKTNRPAPCPTKVTAAQPTNVSQQNMAEQSI